MWYNTFDAVFVLSFTSLLLGSVGMTLAYCFKVKCKTLTLCYGCVDLERDPEAENQELEYQKIILLPATCYLPFNRNLRRIRGSPFLGGSRTVSSFLG